MQVDYNTLSLNRATGQAEFYANEVMSHPFTFKLGGGKAAKIKATNRLCLFVQIALKHWGANKTISEMPEGISDWSIVVPDI